MHSFEPGGRIKKFKIKRIDACTTTLKMDAAQSTAITFAFCNAGQYNDAIYASSTPNS
jgi:hypothetical protein